MQFLGRLSRVQFFRWLLQTRFFAVAVSDSVFKCSRGQMGAVAIGQTVAVDEVVIVGEGRCYGGEFVQYPTVTGAIGEPTRTATVLQPQ